MTTLFDANKHEAAAREWIDANPKAFALFERFALEAASKGQRFGISQLTERVRWECKVGITRTDKFRINNNWRAYIGRELVRRHPQLQGLIEFRAVKRAA